LACPISNVTLLPFLYIMGPDRADIAILTLFGKAEHTSVAM
jgi:hypothetical protein